MRTPSRRLATLAGLLALAAAPAFAQSDGPISWDHWQNRVEGRTTDTARDGGALPPLQCRAPEAGWSLELSGPEVTLSSPGRQEERFSAAMPQPVADRDGQWVVRLDAPRGARNAEQGWAVLTRGACRNAGAAAGEEYDLLLVGMQRRPEGACCQPADVAEVAMGPLIDVRPNRAAPGETVRLSGQGFPPDTDVMIAAGPRAGEPRPLLPARTDFNGRIQAELPMPQDAARHGEVVFAIRAPDRGIDATSAPIQVAAAGAGGGADGGLMEVTGTLTREGVECPAMRGDDGRLYTLTGGDLGPVTPGNRVRVLARPAQMSFCNQGTTLAVERVERLGR